MDRLIGGRKLVGIRGGVLLMGVIVATTAMMVSSLALPPGVYEDFVQVQVGNALFTELQNKDENWVAVEGDGRWGWISYGLGMNYFHGHMVFFGLDAEAWYMVTLYSDDPETADLLGSVGYFGFVEKSNWADIAMFKTDAFGYAKIALPDDNLDLVTDPVWGLLPIVDLPLGAYEDVCVHVKYIGQGEIDWGLVSSGGPADTTMNMYEMMQLEFTLEGCPLV